MITRRGLLVGGAAAAGLAAAAVGAWEVAPASLRFRARDTLGLLPEPYVPDVPDGEVRLETVTSEHLGEIDLFTAVPDGHGDGAGLPVVVVLHGASATAADLQGFGLGRFVTAAVREGAPPFVLAGTDDGPAGWVPIGGSDPQAMLREELPQWLAERGYAADRRALWGWSRGGYGALRFVQEEPAWASALALFSPALQPGDPALADLSALDGLPWGLWCGDRDPFHDGALALADAAPTAPEPWVEGDGGHTRVYWNDHTIDAMRFLADHL
jgi:hypothetical protein